MRKPELNFIIDASAFFLFLSLASTGLLIYFVLPPASGLSIWGMDRHIWGEIHFWIAISFLVLIAIHFALHWSWITARVKGNSKNAKISKSRIILAIFLIVFTLILLSIPFLSPVEKTGSTHSGRSAHVESIN